MELAGIGPEDVDVLICGTLSPDIEFPRNHTLIQELLGTTNAMAFDVHNQCSGFLYSLAVADQFIRSGGARHVLIVGSDVHSTGLEFADRSRHVTVLFGDGAGAVVVGAGDDQHGLLGFNLHSEGA